MTGPYARHLQQWLQVFDKLALVINCTCRDHSSQSNRSFRFGLALSVIALEIASSLIILLDSGHEGDGEEVLVEANSQEEEGEESGEKSAQKSGEKSPSPLSTCDLSFLASLQEILAGIKQQVLPSSTTSNAGLSSEPSSQYEVSLLFPPPLQHSSSSPSPQGVILQSLHQEFASSASSSSSSSGPFSSSLTSNSSPSSSSSSCSSFSLLQAQAFLWNKFADERSKFKWQNVTLVIFNEFTQCILKKPPDTGKAAWLLSKMNLQLHSTLCAVIEETFDSQLRSSALTLVSEMAKQYPTEYQDSLNFMHLLTHLYGSCLRLNLSIMNSMTYQVNAISVPLIFHSPAFNNKRLEALHGTFIYSTLIKLNEVPRLLSWLTQQEKPNSALLQALILNRNHSLFLPESLANELLNLFLANSSNGETLTTGATINHLLASFSRCRRDVFSSECKLIDTRMAQLVVTFAVENNLNELLVMMIQRNIINSNNGTGGSLIQNMYPHLMQLEDILHLNQTTNQVCTFDLIVKLHKLLSSFPSTSSPSASTFASSSSSSSTAPSSSPSPLSSSSSTWTLPVDGQITPGALSETIAVACLFFHQPTLMKDAVKSKTCEMQVNQVINFAYEVANKSFPLIAASVDDETVNQFNRSKLHSLNSTSGSSKVLGTPLPSPVKLKKVESNSSSLYYLLRRSLPLDMSRLFSWQERNSFRTSYNAIPTFSNHNINGFTGLTTKLDSLYFIGQGRPCQAYQISSSCTTTAGGGTGYTDDSLDASSHGQGMEGRNEEKEVKEKSSLLLHQQAELSNLAKKASLIAYKNCKKVEIATAAILFQEVTLNDSTNLRLHMAIGDFVAKYAGDFLGFKSHQQEIELGILLKHATTGHDQEQGRAVIKLLQLLVTAFERKYHEKKNISVQECLQWNLVTSFCNNHSIQLPNDFLIKCAQNDDWLLFTICCQMYNYPKECVIKYLSHFNNGCIADHLEKAFLSSACITEKDDSPNSILTTTGKGTSNRNVAPGNLRRNLYDKIGLKKNHSPSRSGTTGLTNVKASPSGTIGSSNSPASPSSFVDDTMSMVSEAVDTSTIGDNFTILSRPLSDSQESGLPSDWIHPPADLYNLVLACQRKSVYSTEQALLISGVTFLNPVVVLLAASIPHSVSWPYTTFDVFCFWLTSAFRSPLAPQVRVYTCWTVEKLINLLNSSLSGNINNLHMLLLGMDLFDLSSSPLTYLVKFLIQFTLEKELYKSVTLLKKFQESYWTINKEQELRESLSSPVILKGRESNNESSSTNAFYTINGMAKLTLALVKSTLESISNFYEMRLLLRHLDFARIQSMFSSEIIEMPNFNKLNRMAQVISETDVDLPIMSLINYSDKSSQYSTAVLNVTKILQQKHYYTEANQLANIAGLPLQQVALNEWKEKAREKHESFNFWIECSNTLSDKVMVSSELLFQFYNEFLPDIGCFLCRAMVQLEVLKAALHVTNITDSQWYNLEVAFYRTLMQIEFSEHRDTQAYDLMWDRIKKVLPLMKDKATNDEQYDFELVESPIQVANELLDQIVSKLVTGDLCIARRFAAIYSYHCKDLDLLVYMDILARRQEMSQIELDYLSSLGVQLSEESLGNLSDVQRLHLMEILARNVSYCSHVCFKRLLSFKISNALGVPYDQITMAVDNLVILEKLIYSPPTPTQGAVSTFSSSSFNVTSSSSSPSSTSPAAVAVVTSTTSTSTSSSVATCSTTTGTITSDMVTLAKEFITMNEIDDTDVAQIILKELVATLRSDRERGYIMVEPPVTSSPSNVTGGNFNCNETNSSANAISSSSTANTSTLGSGNVSSSSNSFLSKLRLLSNPSVLGQQILAHLRNGTLDDQPLSVTVEFYIKAHDCFSVSSDIEGISLVLRNVKCLVMQQLAPNSDYFSMIRVLTGIGRYSEMTYIFDILKEHQKFELLLGRRIEKVPQLRVALLDSLKGDKEMYPMVALNFSMHREIAEMLQEDVMKFIKSITTRRKSLNLSNIRDLLERSLADLVDAAESFDKAFCYNQAKKCTLIAELVALQLHHLNSGIEFLNLSNKAVAQLIATHPNCAEAVIIADAYNHHQSWPDALYNRVIRSGDWSYFREYTYHFGPPNDTLLDELVSKCLQEQSNIPHGSSIESSLQRVLSSSQNVEIYHKLCAKAGINPKIPSNCDPEDKAFIKDILNLLA